MQKNSLQKWIQCMDIEKDFKLNIKGENYE